MIHEALRLIRVFHDLKQNELAEKLKISKSYLSEIENGIKKPSLDLIEKYSSVFKTKPSVILFFSEDLTENGVKPKNKKFNTKIRQLFIKFLQRVEKA